MKGLCFFLSRVKVGKLFLKPISLPESPDSDGIFRSKIVVAGGYYSSPTLLNESILPINGNLITLFCAVDGSRLPATETESKEHGAIFSEKLAGGSLFIVREWVEFRQSEKAHYLCAQILFSEYHARDGVLSAFETARPLENIRATLGSAGKFDEAVLWTLRWLREGHSFSGGAFVEKETMPQKVSIEPPTIKAENMPPKPKWEDQANFNPFVPATKEIQVGVSGVVELGTPGTAGARETSYSHILNRYGRRMLEMQFEPVPPNEFHPCQPGIGFEELFLNLNLRPNRKGMAMGLIFNGVLEPPERMEKTHWEYKVRINNNEVLFLLIAEAGRIAVDRISVTVEGGLVKLSFTHPRPLLTKNISGNNEEAMKTALMNAGLRKILFIKKKAKDPLLDLFISVATKIWKESGPWPDIAPTEKKATEAGTKSSIEPSPAPPSVRPPNISEQIRSTPGVLEERLAAAGYYKTVPG